MKTDFPSPREVCCLEEVNRAAEGWSNMTDTPDPVGTQAVHEEFCTWLA